MNSIQLTKYSHGAGCGCKISPKVLESILQSSLSSATYPNLIVGNESRDDAAVYDLGNGKGLISTTDFFMPIVDDAREFGMIAATNAISDVYAMGGKPIMAIAILGWTINKIPIEAARKVIEGAMEVCSNTGIPLAGGHSIDSPEPIFGLAVNGLVDLRCLKRNNTAKEGNLLYLTKPIGIGILTTAEKKGILKEDEKGAAAEVMLRLNSIGEKLGKMEGVTAMTDVTGFGLLGHLKEMCEGSGLSATINYGKVLKIANLDYYIAQGAIPGGTQRNWDSYGSFISPIDETVKAVLADPQTSGGLLIAVEQGGKTIMEDLFIKEGFKDYAVPIGIFNKGVEGNPLINVEL